LHSKDVLKVGGLSLKIVFETATDVVIDGVPVIRKGALAVGRVTDSKAPGSFGRSAAMSFVIEQVTAIDGQTVVVTGATAKKRNKDVYVDPPANSGAAGPLLTGLLTKGSGALVRAGTTFDVEVAKDCAIKVGK
jgi:hypothetical protein